MLPANNIHTNSSNFTRRNVKLSIQFSVLPKVLGFVELHAGLFSLPNVLYS